MRQRGYLILEVLIAVVIFSTVVLSVFSMVGFLQLRARRSQLEDEAVEVLQEGMEIARTAVVANWRTYLDGDYVTFFDQDIGSWVLVPAEDELVRAKFNRKITLERVCRRENDGLRVDCRSGVLDEKTRNIIVTVSWDEKGLDKEIKAELLALNPN